MIYEKNIHQADHKSKIINIYIYLKKRYDTTKYTKIKNQLCMFSTQKKKIKIDQKMCTVQKYKIIVSIIIIIIIIIYLQLWTSI